jgi:hypothetical protein
MGDADDIMKMMERGTRKWTRQKKAEERRPAARGYRLQRMTMQRDMRIKEAAWKVMQQAYLKASGNDKYPANARQVMYAARPLVVKLVGRELGDNFDQYFCQHLLPDYIAQNGVTWNIAYDARGHFAEPHGGEYFGVGTLEVRNYLSGNHNSRLTASEFTRPAVEVHGPHNNYGAILYIEKEGFDSLLRDSKLAERYDIAIMSNKGVSVTAGRKLVESICGSRGIPLLVLHDFDVAGFTILRTLHCDTRRYSFSRTIPIIDLGLRLDDIDGLEVEPAAASKSDDETIADRLRNAGATEEEIEFLLEQRVELNAMASDEFIEFIERKLEKHGIAKIVPDAKTLKDTWLHFGRGKRLGEEFVKLKKSIDAELNKPTPPSDLEDRISAMLAEDPELSWHEAVHVVLGEEPDRGS